MAVIILYWLHSFPSACLMFLEKLCCVRRPQFPLGNPSEVGAQHINSVSHDSVKPNLFCVFCQVGSGNSTTLWETEKRNEGRFHIYMALGGSSFLMGPTIILVHMGCSLGCGTSQPHRPRKTLTAVLLY
jgi:hypothetical protein